MNRAGLAPSTGSGGGGIRDLPDGGPSTGGGSGGGLGSGGSGGGILIGPGTGGDTSDAGGPGDSGAASGTGGDPGPGGTAGMAAGDAGASGQAGGVGGMGDPGTAGADGAAAGCDPTTCPDGCCNGKICLTTKRTNRRCGTGGAACAACGSCFTCSAGGTCDVTPDSQWTVTCDAATIAPTNVSTGQPWSGSGPGDTNVPQAFCQLRLNRALVGESSVEETLSPAWTDSGDPASVTVNAALLTSGRWSVYVGDGSSGLMVQSTSVCEATFSPAAADFAAGRLALTDLASCQSLQLGLACN